MSHPARPRRPAAALLALTAALATGERVPGPRTRPPAIAAPGGRLAIAAPASL